MTKHPETFFEHDQKYLLVTSSGKFQIDWFLELISSISQKVKEMNPKAILLDMRGITGKMSFLDRYRAGHRASEQSFMIPVAVVGNETIIDPRRLGEIVARNRGMNIRVFTDLKEAQLWLDNYSA